MTNNDSAPRILIVTDQTSLARALEQHVSIIWPEAVCRIHAPLHSGRLHPAFSAIGYDAVLLDDFAEKGLGLQWLENLLHRPGFPPIVYIAPSSNPLAAAHALERGAIECLVRERIDNGKLANALRAGVEKHRKSVVSTPEQSRFGPITVPDYRFVRELALGGTSMVYLAESVHAGEMVVLKVLRRDLEKSSATQFARFRQEYELISKIRHPNVVRIFDVGASDEHAYIGMEYFPKGDLRAHISKGIDPVDVLKYLAQMASALEVVHAVGVLHRDLKPGNVMVRNDGSVALIDFGLAKHFEPGTDITATGEIFGTPYYMSPEQGHGHELDERSDLYSLGVIFHEMLTRRKPFLAPRPMEVIYLHANAPRPVLEGELRAFQPVLDKLLACKPEDRYASASELLSAIDELSREYA